ncbi:cytochrome P450 [Pseudonocardia sp. GCM10023141]|uniref:cytochrome P450 n=1 Tax=Pseudonocardia sp. GCM10023141 TaxID=3252653 RepID=UPI00361D1850
MRNDLDAAGPAVEELLRFCSVLQMSIPRTATRDQVLAGHHIAEDDTVMVSLAAANRDPRLLADGDTLDIARTPVPHVAFGHGIHHCLGAGLARAETAIALPALLRRFPALRLAAPAGDIHFRPPGVFYGVQTLPVTW